MMNARYSIIVMGWACSGETENKSIENQPSTEETSEPSQPVSEPEATFAYYTQGFEGEAIVVPGVSYDGIESVVRAVNEVYGTGEVDEKLVWNLYGTPIEEPPECGNCLFAFEILAEFDAEASIDPDEVGLDSEFSYALGQSDYGISLFYRSAQGWFAWITHGSHMTDYADVSHWETVSFEGNRFDYSDRIVDFYYYY